MKTSRERMISAKNCLAGLCLYSMFFFICAIPTSADAQVGRVEFIGEISAIYPNSPTAGFTSSFRVLLDEGKWNIKISGARIGETAYDGDHVYGFSYFGKEFASESINDSTGSIYEMDLPAPEYMDTHGPWFAYASAAFFNGETNRIRHIFAAANPEWLLSGVTFPMTVERMLLPPHLPTHVRIYSEGTIYPNQRRKPTRSHRPPYDEGFLQAEFRTLEVTNVGNWSVPRRFVWKQFRPGSGNSSDDIQVFQETIGILHEVNFIADDLNIVPQVTGATYTSDRRFGGSFSSVLEVIYLNTNAFWLPRDHPIVQELFLDAARDAPHQGPSPSTRNYIALLFMIAVAFPLLFFFINRHKG